MSAITAERAEIDIPDAGRLGPPHETGEPTDARARLSGDSQAAPRRKSGLLVTVSSLAIVAIAAVGLYEIGVHRPHVANVGLAPGSHPGTHVAASTPASSLARVPLPAHVTPLPAVPSDGGDDMAAFLRDGGHASPTDAHPGQPAPAPAITPAVATPAPKPNLPAPVASTANTQPASRPAPLLVPPAVAEAAKPAPAAATVSAPSPAPHSAVSTAAAPNDAASIAAKLVPGRMTDEQQIQVLDLVTKLGTLVRDQHIEIAELQQAVSGLQGHVDTSLTDFGRRLTLAEATGAVNGAAATPVTLPMPSKPLDGVSPAVARVVVHPPVTTDAGPHRYHVQAASPGLAMLSELDASGGEEAQIPVTPGDTLPGYGPVVSISQRGSAWVVRTEHGYIQ